jgi:hypothetical protein
MFVTYAEISSNVHCYLISLGGSRKPRSRAAAGAWASFMSAAQSPVQLRQWHRPFHSQLTSGVCLSLLHDEVAEVYITHCRAGKIGYKYHLLSYGCRSIHIYVVQKETDKIRTNNISNGEERFDRTQQQKWSPYLKSMPQTQH